MANVNVALIGIGNCASALVQGLEYYRDLREDERVPGLMHTVLGGYRVDDVRVVAAFDVDRHKVGKDLAAAIFEPPNNTLRFTTLPERLGVSVLRGMTHDGIGRYTERLVRKASGPPADVAKELRDANAHVVVNFLPVGSEEATKWYVEETLRAGCALVNCIPVFIASDVTGYWPRRFEDAGLPVLGDDVKSQVGATIVHRVLARLFQDRGVQLKRTYQLNFGGNTDFLNMLERERLVSKKVSKTEAVTSQLDADLLEDDVHVGPSDHVPWLADRKFCHVRMEGEGFGGAPINLELKLEVWDSPNSAGVVIDAVRCAKLALDWGLTGSVDGPSAYFFKRPPVQLTDDAAREEVETFIEVMAQGRNSGELSAR